MSEVPAWRSQKPQRSDGELVLDGQAVVGVAEKELQEALARSLARPGDRVIEIGYGLGLAHDALRQIGLGEHWVIEGNKWLAAECISESSGDSSVPIVVFDTWEHALGLLPAAYFDAILFDPFPLDKVAEALPLWRDKFAYVANRAAGPMCRVLKTGALLGIINFDLSTIESRWIEESFESRFKTVPLGYEDASLNSAVQLNAAVQILAKQ